MDYDNPYKEDFPPKNYADNMQSIKYKIFDYKQTKKRRKHTEINFWFYIDYSGQDISIYDRTKYPEGMIPFRYKLIIGRSNKIRVYKNDSPTLIGILRLNYK